MTRSEKILKKNIDEGGDKSIKLSYLKAIKPLLIQAMKEIVFDAVTDNQLNENFELYPPDHTWDLINHWCDEKVEILP